MKRKQVGLISCLLMLLLSITAAAQTQQAPPKKQSDKNPPNQGTTGKVKHEPQFPNIINLENKAASQEKTEKTDTASAGTQSPGLTMTPQQTELLVRAVESLTQEVHGLVQEMRALNVRQQAQLDVLRMTRGDAKIEAYEKEYRTTHERVMQLEVDEQNLQMLMKPESLLAQTRTVGTTDRNETIRQLKAAHEAKLQAVTTEKEAMQKREADLLLILDSYQTINNEAERRIKLAEELIRQLGMPTTEKK